MNTTFFISLCSTKHVFHIAKDTKNLNRQPPSASISPQKLNHLILHKTSSLKSDEVKVKEKVESIRKRLRSLGEDPLKELIMIDTIKRLGIDHLFREVITAALHKHYIKCFSQSSGVDACSNDLREVSLLFRLLRQEGYYISPKAFDGFLSQDMKFKEELGKDTEALECLFEASHMSMQDESILDEANVFSKRILTETLEKLDKSKTMLLQNTLKYPQHTTLARFTAHDILSRLSNTKGWRNELQELAKIHFNAAQKIYHNEILHISNWWKKLGLAKELNFARNQPRKWHMWSLAALTDPSLSEERLELTKPVSFIYIIDDIFDVYGTPEHLSLFTEAVNRWEFDTLDMLPDYMKLCLKALFNVTNEISQRIWLKYGFDPKESLQKQYWMDLFNAFLVESKWFATKYLPTTAEYLKVATVTSGVHVVLTHMYFLLGEVRNDYSGNGRVLNKDYTRIISSSAMILRFWDDLGSCENEDQDGHDGSYIKCYMNEHGVTYEVARERVIDLISCSWKNLNQECMHSPLRPMSLMKGFNKGCLNLAKMVPLMYSYDENHKLPELEKFVTLLLYHRY